MTPIAFEDVTVQPSVIDRETWGMHFEKYLTYIDKQKGWAVFQDDLNKGETLVSSVAQHGFKAIGAHKLLEGLALNPHVATWRHWVALQKVQAVAKIIGEEYKAGDYDRIVVFAWRKLIMQELQWALHKEGVRAVQIYANSNPIRKGRALKKFAKGDVGAAILRIDAATPVVDIASASQVAFLETDWSSLASNMQAVLRVHNGEQMEPVNVRFFSTAGTYDEKVQRLCKQMLRRALTDEGEDFLRE